ncbi:MAG: hypothetical protein DCF20_07565 [Pseudanabaena sp.]|nr:MAG: hypothetical protein DCF20_07565 [Pseudanabaena sp.]
MPSEIMLGTKFGTNFFSWLNWLHLVCELYNTNLSIWHILFLSEAQKRGDAKRLLFFGLHMEISL